MRAEMVDTGAHSRERAGEKCVFYLTETYMDVGQRAIPRFLITPRMRVQNVCRMLETASAKSARL